MNATLRAQIKGIAAAQFGRDIVASMCYCGATADPFLGISGVG